MYADDTLLINNGKTLLEVTDNSQQTLNQISNWCTLNKMSINICKTKFMIVTPTTTDNVLPKDLYIRTTRLSQVHVYEYLCVHINDKLTMNAHIDKVCTNVQTNHGILRKIQRYIRKETALLIYNKVMIRPHFDHGVNMIDSGTQNKLIN